MLPSLNPNAAGIDIGATEIYIAVPGDRDRQPVRCFATRTEDLHAAADWLKACHIEMVAMESTGVYWILFFQIMEARGFRVFLVWFGFGRTACLVCSICASVPRRSITQKSRVS